MSWREARVAAYQGKMHGRKSVQGHAMARREFAELTGGGDLTRFDCSLLRRLHTSFSNTLEKLGNTDIGR